MQQQGGGGQMRQLRRRQPTGETVLTRWVGHFVVVKYLAGPAMLADPEDPRSLAVSHPEARSGIFHLQRFGQLGISTPQWLHHARLRTGLIARGARGV
jgi:hypothetical protein